MKRAGTLGQFPSWVRTLIVFGVLLWAFFALFPMYWVFITSVKEVTAVNVKPTYLPWIDFSPTLHAWEDIFSGIRGNFSRNLMSSTIVGISASIVATLLGSMAAYALARYRFRVRLGTGLAFAVVAIGGYLLLEMGLGMRTFWALNISFFLALALAIFLSRFRLPGPVLGNEDIIFWFVSQRMFPPIVAAFALFLLFTEFGRSGLKLKDTFLGLTLCYVAFSLPIVVWLMRDFFASVPVEIEEAAIVDDVPMWRVFFQIVLPMVLPGLAATFMITLAFIWNEFLFALFLTDSDWQTLPILVGSQHNQRGDEWWALSAAVVIAITPMMVMAWALGRMMRAGLQVGSIK